jgi:protocatechuate 3,4-dioxygenase beta subunit
MEKYDVPFLTGVIEDDEEKTRFNWGVRSLPWLILTDKEHNVTAEGFVAAELDAKINEIGPSASTPVDSNMVTGLVKDAQDRPLSGVRVTEFQTDKDYTADADGRFISAFGPSDKQRFFFAVDKQRELVGVGRLTPEERHVEIKLVPAKIVSGTVVDPDGKPVTGAQVAPLPMTCFHVLTDRQGRFDVAWSPSWEPGEGLCLMVRHVDLNLAALADIAEDAENIEVKLTGALTLTGIVEDPNGKPISGAKTSISLIKGWDCGMPVNGAITNNHGRFELYCLPQNQEYGVRARAEGFWQNQITTGIINRITDREEVGPIILKRPILTVSGVVVHAGGKVVANIPVHLQGEGQPSLDAQTDSDGRFTFEKVCCGPIRISAKNDALFGKIETKGGVKNVKLVVRPRFE